MARQPRLQFEGAFYHIYSRGNRRERIFLEAADYQEFEEIVLDQSARSNGWIYGTLLPFFFFK
jgi:putative transposase